MGEWGFKYSQAHRAEWASGGLLRRFFGVHGERGRRGFRGGVRAGRFNLDYQPFDEPWVKTAHGACDNCPICCNKYESISSVTFADLTLAYSSNEVEVYKIVFADFNEFGHLKGIPFQAEVFDQTERSRGTAAISGLTLGISEWHRGIIAGVT